MLLIVIPTLAFFLTHLSSDTIARNVLGPNATPEQVAKQAEILGLDQPVLVQYWTYVVNALQGDLGASYFTGEPVSSAMASRVPVTLSLVLLTTIIAALVAVVAGVAAAVYRGWIDRVVQILTIVGFALPGFWLALMFALIFAIKLQWFPATGYIAFLASPAGWAYSLVLPVASLAVGAVASTAQQIRGEVVDMLRQDWVRTLRARGLSERRVLFRHVLRNASVSGLIVLALQFVGLLGGAVFVERIFALPGIGQVLAQSTAQNDIPMVMGVVIVTTLIVVVVNLTIDLSVGFLNPKARFE